jgi:hypothetical protein
MLKATKTGNSAKVVDGKLILSLPGAETPVVWQMDLDQAKSSALEVLNKGETSILSLKTLSGKITEIASFKERDEAVSALMDASKALENAHGHIRAASDLPAASNGNAQYAVPKKKSAAKKWIIGILVLIALWFIFPIIITALQPQLLNAPGSGIANTSTPANNDARQSQGVPVSADDFLQ